MNNPVLVELTSRALLLCLWVSLPTVVVAALVGIIVSFLQAVTSLQDSSISHAAKFVAVVVVLLACAPWGSAMILSFARSAFQAALE